MRMKRIDKYYVSPEDNMTALHIAISWYKSPHHLVRLYIIIMEH